LVAGLPGGVLAALGEVALADVERLAATAVPLACKNERSFVFIFELNQRFVKRQN
jgi:hypothetical protein